MIVVLAGDFSGNRILKAADVARQGFAPHVLVSGTSGEYGFHETDLAIPFAVRHGFPQSYFIALPNDARSTKDEAAEVLAALAKRNVHLNFTADGWWHNREGRKTFLLEWTKTVGTWFGM